MIITDKIKKWMMKSLFNIGVKAGFEASVKDASTQSYDEISGIVGRVGLRNGDSQSNDFEEAEYDLSVISNAYDGDAYIRQGVDKYVDQVFKEGHGFYGKDEGAVEYIKARFQYMSETTKVPTEQLLIEIVEDVVKFSNAMVVKVRMKDQKELPQGYNITGINGAEPTVGLFCINPTTLTVKRDKYGTVKQWQQEVDGSDTKAKFNAADVVHFYYKRERGNAFGTPFLHSVLDDVRALRQAEENALKMLYRNVYPLIHAQIGDNEKTGTKKEIQEFTDTANNMDIETGILVTSERVNIKPIATDKVVESAPYLEYLEQRVFSGMGIPAILFGRGEGASRSTGDNMTTEMAGRVRAIQRTIEMFFNGFIIREMLLEGGYDPLLNPDHNVEFRFKENDVDTLIKKDVHAVYLYEHNAIDENEMRALLGRDPVTDRSLMHQNLITNENYEVQAEIDARYDSSSSTSTSTSTDTNKSTTNKTSETDSKETPTNQHGTKSSPKKQTNSQLDMFEGIIKDEFDNIIDHSKGKNGERLSFEIKNLYDSIKIMSEMLQIYNSEEYIKRVEGYLNSKADSISEINNYEENLNTLASMKEEVVNIFRKEI